MNSLLEEIHIKKTILGLLSDVLIHTTSHASSRVQIICEHLIKKAFSKITNFCMQSAFSHHILYAAHTIANTTELKDYMRSGIILLEWIYCFVLYFIFIFQVTSRQKPNAKYTL